MIADFSHRHTCSLHDDRKKPPTLFIRQGGGFSILHYLLGISQASVVQ